MTQLYLPEGFAPAKTPTLSDLETARLTGQILEARAVLCDGKHDLYVDLGAIRGTMERTEAALGVREGTVKDIAVLSRVGKPVCFKVLDANGSQAVLSRRAAQEQALADMLDTYEVGDVLWAKITHLEPFGAFCDIGCGIIGLINIENISVSRISHPRDRFTVGQCVKTVIRDIDRENKRFSLSHKELLGTWEENASLFSVGETVCGTVRSVEDYGIFIELMPNLTGLCEYRDGVRAGQSATVYIKSILPEKMKVKLSLVDVCPEPITPAEPRYFFSGDHMDRFLYSPTESRRTVLTDFA